MTARRRSSDPTSGSPSKGGPEYLLIGVLRRPHGLHGEILMDVITDFPERLGRGVVVFLGGRHRRATIASCRRHPQGLLMRFQGTDAPEDAEAYRNQAVYVPTANRPRLPAGTYYHHELLGCKVVDEARGTLGELTEILQTGANDVWIIKPASGREVLLPAIRGVIVEIDTPRRLIRVRVPDGQV